MKVAYNACYGGFGLSPIAETEYSAKKGINLTWYRGVGEYPYDYFVRVSDLSQDFGLFELSASNADLGEKVTEIPVSNYFYRSWHSDDQIRSDPDLIEVIERLGNSANGSCASLAIKEITDGVQFEITQYYGFEDVVPTRASW